MAGLKQLVRDYAELIGIKNIPESHRKNEYLMACWILSKSNELYARGNRDAALIENIALLKSALPELREQCKDRGTGNSVPRFGVIEQRKAPAVR